MFAGWILGTFRANSITSTDLPIVVHATDILRSCFGYRLLFLYTDTVYEHKIVVDRLLDNIKWTELGLNLGHWGSKADSIPLD